MSFDTSSQDSASALRRATPGVDRAIGARLQQRRLDLAMDLQHLSQVTGILAPRSMAIEAGEVRPTASELYQLAKSLDLRISDLFHDVTAQIN